MDGGTLRTQTDLEELERPFDTQGNHERVQRFGDSLDHHCSVEDELSLLRSHRRSQRSHLFPPCCSNMLACLHFYLGKIFFQVMVTFIRYQFVQDYRERY
jgi:hypothetical protein